MNAPKGWHRSQRPWSTEPTSGTPSGTPPAGGGTRPKAFMAEMLPMAPEPPMDEKPPPSACAFCIAAATAAFWSGSASDDTAGT